MNENKQTDNSESKKRNRRKTNDIFELYVCSSVAKDGRMHENSHSDERVRTECQQSELDQHREEEKKNAKPKQTTNSTREPRFFSGKKSNPFATIISGLRCEILFPVLEPIFAHFARRCFLVKYAAIMLLFHSFAIVTLPHHIPNATNSTERDREWDREEEMRISNIVQCLHYHFHYKFIFVASSFVTSSSLNTVFILRLSSTSSSFCSAIDAFFAHLKLYAFELYVFLSTFAWQQREHNTSPSL